MANELTVDASELGASEPKTREERVQREERRQERRVERLDRAGTVASFLCAIHCAALPLVITLLPLLGLNFLASEPVEWLLLVVSACLGVISICFGFRKHRSPRVWGLAGTAIALLFLARVWAHSGHGHTHDFSHHEAWLETGLMVAGGTMMMSAHWLNQKLCHACSRCHSHSRD